MQGFKREISTKINASVKLWSFYTFAMSDTYHSDVNASGDNFNQLFLPRDSIHGICVVFIRAVNRGYLIKVNFFNDPFIQSIR